MQVGEKRLHFGSTDLARQLPHAQICCVPTLHRVPPSVDGSHDTSSRDGRKYPNNQDLMESPPRRYWLCVPSLIALKTRGPLHPG